MTPEEKAKELFERYKPLAWGNTAFTRNERIKKCAAICVDEIITIITQVRATLDVESDGYWEQVKQEIEKL